MGDPKKHRKKYSNPVIPWNKERIEEEKLLLKEYGLKNKKEIYKADSLLRKYFSLSKKLVANRTAQGELEKQQLLDKLTNLGLLKPGSDLSDVLGITINKIFERRLQTIVFRKKLAKSIKQSRQFITHQHITVAGKKITSPSYFVTTKEESIISFVPSSDLSNLNHPERIISEKPKKTSKPHDKKDKNPRRKRVVVRKGRKPRQTQKKNKK